MSLEGVAAQRISQKGWEELVTRYYIFAMFALAVAVGATTAVAETTTIVVPVLPGQGAVWVELPPHGIDPAEATVSGALRGVTGISGSSVVYEPSQSAFERTRFDVFRVEGSGRALRVVAVTSQSLKLQGTRVGATGTLGVGWETLGSVTWDQVLGAYVTTGAGELSFDFLRDSIDYLVPDIDLRTGVGDSEAEITLRPPPPGGGAAPGLPTEAKMLVYQAGGRGDDLWELWLVPNAGAYDLELVVIPAAGGEVHATMAAPPQSELEMVLGWVNDDLRLVVAGWDQITAERPEGVAKDATWHRFGNLLGGGGSLELDELRIQRVGTVLERELVAADDFETGSWAGTWSSPARGALHVGSEGPMSSTHDHVLVASVDRARVVGPDYLVRFLTVPRSLMACRFDLDASSLTSLESSGVKVFALRDVSHEPPRAGEYARLLVRHRQPGPEIRLVAGGTPATATPWIPLGNDAATIEVQWEKTQAEGVRLDLWIDGCGPDPLACESGWGLQGAGQSGLVTAVQLGAVGGLLGDTGVLRFDDVACVGDSWNEELP